MRIHAQEVGDPVVGLGVEMLVTLRTAKNHPDVLGAAVRDPGNFDPLDFFELLDLGRMVHGKL